jgi:hypothetical protein
MWFLKEDFLNFSQYERINWLCSDFDFSKQAKNQIKC